MTDNTPTESPPRDFGAVLWPALGAFMLLAAAVWTRAGEPSFSADSSLRPAAGAGGEYSSSANHRLEPTIGEDIAASTSSAGGSLEGSGAHHIHHFPDTVTTLTGIEGARFSSATLQWTAPGFDGARGDLQAGTTYMIRVASFTAPYTFVSSAANIVFSTQAASSPWPGAAVSTPAYGLIANTTYFAQLWTADSYGNISYGSSRATFTTLAVTVNKVHPTADPFLLDDVLQFSGVYFTSVTVRWAALPLQPPAADEVTGKGYIVEASSTNFGALSPGGVISSSITYSLRASTLVVDTPPLQTNKDYYFRVGSLNHASFPNYLFWGSTKTNLQAVDPDIADPPYPDVSSHSVTADWLRNGNADSTIFTLRVSSAADFLAEAVTSSNTFDTYMTTFGLVRNTTYYFNVMASTGVSSTPWFDMGSTCTLTAPPAVFGENPFADVGVTQLTVKWSANTNTLAKTTYTVAATPALGYPNSDPANVSFDTVPAGAIPAGTFSPGITPNTTYHFYAAGVNWHSSPSAYAYLGSTSTLAAMPSLDAPTYWDVSPTSFSVRWGNNSNPFSKTTYTITVSTAPNFDAAGPPYQISLDTVPGAETMASFTDLIQNATYFTRVAAFNHAGIYTNYRDLSSTATLAEVPSSLNFSGVFPTETALRLDWSANGNADADSVAHTTYTVVVSTQPQFGSGAYVTTHTTTGLFLSTGVLSINTTYYFRAKSRNHNGWETDWSYASTSTLANIPTAAPAPDFEPIHITSFTVRWDRNGNPASAAVGYTTYTVEMSASQAFSPFETDKVVMDTVPTSAYPAASFTAMSPNTTYYFRVHAHNQNHVATSWAVLGETSTLAALPISPSVTAVYYSSMVVTWTPAAASGYDLKGSSTNVFNELGPAPGGVVALSSTTLGSTNYLLLEWPALEPNATYFFRFASLNRNSVPSGVFVSSASTLADPVANGSFFPGGFTGVFATSATVTWIPRPSAAVAGASRTAEGYVLEATTADTEGVTDWSGEIFSSATLVVTVTNQMRPSTLTVIDLLSATTYAFRIGTLNWSGATHYALIGSTKTRQDPFTWTGGGGNNLWYTAANWNPNGIPGAGSPVTIAPAADVSVYVPNTAQPISFSSLTIGGLDPAFSANLTLATTVARGGSVLVRKSAGLTLATSRQILLDGDFTMLSGSSLTHRPFAVTVSSVNIKITGTFDIQAGATVTVSSMGFAGGPSGGASFGTGPGGGGASGASSAGGAGGGHGGLGGGAGANTQGPANDDTYNPEWAGSGGGGGDFASGFNVGGDGGGAVILEAQTINLDGRIEADGEPGGPGAGASNVRAAGGGGAGGTVNLRATYLVGQGTVTALGASGGPDTDGTLTPFDDPGGGGAGGRVAINIQNSGNLCAISVSTAGGAKGGGNSTAGEGGTYSSTVTLAIPGFSALYSSATDIHWNWTTVTGATTYQIVSSTGGAGQSPVFTAQTTSYSEPELSPNTTYTRQVEIFTCGGSTGSAFASYATLAGAPGYLGYYAIYLTSAAVRWAAKASGEAVGYVLEASSTNFGAIAPGGGIVYSSTTYSRLASTLTVGAGVDSLETNTTYYFRVASLNHASQMSTYTVLGATSTLSFQPNTLGSAVFKDDTGKSTAFESSITANWARLALASEQGSSMTSQGYLLEASSTNFSALSPAGTLHSSRTFSVLASTLAVGVGADPALERCTTYYFRVASFNWNGTTSAYTSLGSTMTVIDWGTVMAQATINAGGLELATEYVIGTGITVTNTGNCATTYWIKAATITAASPWTIDTSSGTDTFTLQAAFNSAEPGLGDFVDLDKVTDTPGASSAASFALDENGVSVPWGDVRTLWLKIGMPRISSTDSAQDIQVTVYAMSPQ